MQTIRETMSDEFPRRSGHCANYYSAVRMLGGGGPSSYRNWDRLAVGDSAIVATALQAQGG